MIYETIIVKKEDGVGVITLNRPEQRNALSNALTIELDQVVTHFEDDKEVKAIVITGTGDEAFSAGGDLHELSQLAESEYKAELTARIERHWHLANCTKPTIGAINGLAIGGGAMLASVLDIRLGCERTRFRFLSAVYSRVNATWSLPLIVGWPMAKELLFTGRMVKAEEAMRIGLLNRLVSASELMPVAMEMGRLIAANDAIAVQSIKKIMVGDIGKSWREMLNNEVETVSQSMKVPPYHESFKDFLESRANS